MIGASGHQLDMVQLEILSRDRKHAFQQNAIARRNAALQEIENNDRVPPNDEHIDKLPFDVLEQILKYTNDPKEVVKLWVISDDFRQILKRKYVETKFPEILQFILETRPLYLFEPENEDHDFDQVPYIFMANYNGIDPATSVSLFMRGISRQCKKSAEALIPFDSTILSFNTLHKLQPFTQYLSENPSAAHSFYPRGVRIDEKFQFMFVNANDGPFHQEVNTFLDLVGNRMKFFSYVSHQRLKKTTYDRLCEWVALMPNLEKLHLKCCVYSGRRVRGQRKEKTPDFDRIPRFPDCPSLRSFNEECAWKAQLLPEPYMQRILEACPNLTDLRLFEGADRRNLSLSMLNVLPNLSSLKISPDYSFLCHHRWTQLSTLILANSFPFIQISSYLLFPILRQFEDTLEHLELAVDVYYNGGDAYLHLRNLKTLKWKHHESFKNVQFLLYTEKLETLHIFAGIKNPSDPFARACMKCYVDKLVGGESGTFEGKRIWDVLPYLKRIEITRKYSIGDDIFLNRPTRIRRNL